MIGVLPRQQVKAINSGELCQAPLNAGGVIASPFQGGSVFGFRLREMVLYARRLAGSHPVALKFRYFLIWQGISP